jgi:ABC-type branched-subunit amino acid transport system substrate-binding protein
MADYHATGADSRSERAGEGEAASGDGSLPSVSRRNVLATGAAVSAVGLAGCSDGGGGGGGTFTIGVNLPFSQGWKPYGQPILNTAKLMRDRINDADGLAGDQIELVVEDTQAAPDTAVQKANKLIQQDGIDLMLGPLTSASRTAVSPVLERNQVPAMYVIDYEGPAAEDYCNKWQFKFGETPPQQVNPFLPWLMEEYGSSFYLIGQDYIWPQTMNDLIREYLENNGGTVLDEQYVQFGTTDFSSIIPRIENADPDILFMTVTGGSAVNLQKQMGNRGVRDQFQDVGLAHIQPVLAGIPNDAVEGLINCRDYFETLDNEVNQQYLSEYYDRFGDDAPMSTHAGLAHMAMQTLEKALNERGGTSNEDILQGLPGTTVDSPMGTRTLEHDHQANHGCTAAEVGSDKKFDAITQFDTVMPPETCSEF